MWGLWWSVDLWRPVALWRGLSCLLRWPVVYGFGDTRIRRVFPVKGRGEKNGEQGIMSVLSERGGPPAIEDRGAGTAVLVTAFGSGSPKAKSTTWLRAQAFAEELETQGVRLGVSGTVPPFVYPWGWEGGWSSVLKRIGGISVGAVKRLVQAALLPYRYDVHLALRDVFLFTGPPVFEKLFARRAPFFVFEIDDAIWEPPPDGKTPPLWTPERVITAARLADRMIVGNEYLATWARAYCDDVRIIPTVPDDAIIPRQEERAPGPCRIGWYGQMGGFHFVVPFLPALAAVSEKTGAQLHLLSHPDIASYCEYPVTPRVVPWDPATEGSELSRFDVGIMPMPDTVWTRGKCSNKIIHYMAAGLPVVASPYGMNSEVVRHGETGFWAETPEEWTEALLRLAEDPQLRTQMGKAGRALYEERYSHEAVLPHYREAITPPAGIGRRRFFRGKRCSA